MLRPCIVKTLTGFAANVQFFFVINLTEELKNLAFILIYM
jgi:hypothetical protein